MRDLLNAAITGSVQVAGIAGINVASKAARWKIGADLGVKIDDKIKAQLADRGWNEQEIKDAANGPRAGTTIDNRRPSKTADGQGRTDSATVYGTKGGYVVVNDRTREVVQVSDRTTGSGWIPDSRIKWDGDNR